LLFKVLRVFISCPTIHITEATGVCDIRQMESIQVVLVKEGFMWLWHSLAGCGFRKVLLEYDCFCLTF